MEYTEIQKLIDSMGESKLTDLSIEFADGTKISMKKEAQKSNVVAVASEDVPSNTVASESAISQENKQGSSSDSSMEVAGNLVKSPMVGTFYSRSNPTAEAFVKVGDVVKKGQTLCIIEAMKLMNEIEAEESGEIKRIFAKDGEMVEYGQPLFEIAVR